MKRLVKRLSQTSVAELVFRTRERTCVAAEAVRYATGQASWHPQRLTSQLLPLSPELVDARQRLASGNFAAADLALRAHFVARQQRFVLNPADAPSVGDAIRAEFPRAADEARRHAERLLDGHLALLGYSDLPTAGSKGGPGWHGDPVHQRGAPRRFWARVPYLDPHVGDHKIIWEYNRHQHWLKLGRAAWLTPDDRCAELFQRELDDWLKENPPLCGINWSSMLELGLRSLSWLWALHFFVPIPVAKERPWIAKLLEALDAQLNHIARHLSVYFSPNTHLLGEGLALYVAGRALPELRSAGRWEALGRSILLREATRQVHDDGGHAELSAHYHRYALDFYLLALAIARQTNDPAQETLTEVVERMAGFCRAMVDDAGRLPTIGDDDGGLLFPICDREPADAGASLSFAAALLGRPELAVSGPHEEVLWLLNGDRERARLPVSRSRPGSQLFATTGYAVLRSAFGHAIMDVGRQGFLNGGHSHADALSVVLSLPDRALLIDPGTSTYTMDPAIRDRYRSTAMHNTLMLDREPQARPASAFHWHSRADATVTLWRQTPEGDVVEALHDGYAPQVHKRILLRDACGLWLVADDVLGSGEHRCDVHWHVAPSWALQDSGAGTARLADHNGAYAAIASTAGELNSFYGDATGLGWCAPIYGQHIPSLTVRFSERLRLPAAVVTAIAASRSPVELTIVPADISSEPAEEWRHSAVTGTHAADRFLFTASSPATIERQHPQRAFAAADGRRRMRRVRAYGSEFTTDARIAFLRLSSELEPLSLLMIDATFASWGSTDGFAVGPLSSAADLHLDRDTLSGLSRKGTSSVFERAATVCAE